MEKLEITEAIFGTLYPYVIDDNVTDIKWNGRNVWIDDLNKGRYKARDYKGNYLKLDYDWIKSFAAKLSNTMNTNFNNSSPSLQAETDELRIHVVHSFVNGTNDFLLTIRKTPSVSRLEHIDLIASGYVDETIEKLLPAIIRSRLSGCVIGDVGAGKTELEKYLCKFIPENDGIVTVEDTLEMKLTKLYPEKDVASLKISKSYTAVDAIRDALRLLVKWLILSEARGREIVQVMEAASTGCVAMASIHAENAWDIPDRMLNMAGDESREGFENDIYTFFNYAIKVKKGFTENGIQRKIDQVVFFSRENNENKVTIFYKDGKLTGKELPQVILDKMRDQKEFLEMYCKIFNKPFKKDEVEVVETKPVIEVLNKDIEIKDTPEIVWEEKTEEAPAENHLLDNENEKPSSMEEEDLAKNTEQKEETVLEKSIEMKELISNNELEEIEEPYLDNSIPTDKPCSKENNDIDFIHEIEPIKAEKNEESSSENNNSLNLELEPIDDYFDGTNDSKTEEGTINLLPVDDMQKERINENYADSTHNETSNSPVQANLDMSNLNNKNYENDYSVDDLSIIDDNDINFN